MQLNFADRAAVFMSMGAALPGEACVSSSQNASSVAWDLARVVAFERNAPATEPVIDSSILTMKAGGTTDPSIHPFVH